MLRIAVCDDDKQMLDSLSAKISDCFSRRNESVLAEKFSSGAEFLTAHKAEPFDVIFLDIRMPERDGFDVAREICALSAKTYIIFVPSFSTGSSNARSTSCSYKFPHTARSSLRCRTIKGNSSAPPRSSA